MNLLRRSLLFTTLLLCFSCLADAQSASPSPTPPFVKAVHVYAGKHYCPQPQNEKKENQQALDKLCQAGIGDRIVVEVEGLSDEIAKGTVTLSNLALFLGGRPLKGLNAITVNDGGIAFDLKRTTESTEAWTALLAQPDLDPYRPQKVSVGPADKEAFRFADAAHPPMIALRVYYPRWAIGSLIALLLCLGLFVYLAKTTGVIRDSSPPELSSRNRPYSLGRTQAAVWFFLVIGSFIFLYLITGDYNTITEQALILMGIGTGTALGAAMIDASKNDTANGELSTLNPERARLAAEVADLTGKGTELTNRIAAAGAAATAEDKEALAGVQTTLAEKQAQLVETDKKITAASAGLSKPASENFRKDLLTDVNGINFHRFQIVVWTIVLAVLFCIGVYKELAMPQFSTTLLALMGISSVTYLGFKIPEKQNE